MFKTATPVKGPLVPNAEFPHTSTSDRKKKQSQRDERYALQAKMQWDLVGNRRVNGCTRCRIDRTKKIEAVLKRQADGSLVSYYANAQKCGSVWLCPVCSNKIRNVRAKEMTEVITAHIDSGHGALVSLLTLSHHRGSTLAQTLGHIESAWSNVTRHREFKAFRERHGIVGYIKALEVTNGLNGWHPHYHLIWLTEAPVSERQRQIMDAELYRIWSKYVTNYTDRTVTRQANGLEQIKSGRAIGRYLAKNIAYELTHGHVKNGKKSGQRTPFQIASDYFETGDAADEALWNEYEKAIKGRHFVTWSRSLKDLRTDARTDEEISEAEVDGVEVARVEIPDQYRVRGWQNSTKRSEILSVLEDDGPLALNAYLQHLIKRQDE